MKPFLYGLDYASHDFREASSLGKNIFTNAFPLSLAQYLSAERKLPIPTITATLDSADRLTTKHVMTEWSEIIGTEPDRAHFELMAWDRNAFGQARPQLPRCPLPRRDPPLAYQRDYPYDLDKASVLSIPRPIPTIG